MPNRTNATLTALALLAVLVLSLGLPRLFVLCRHDGGGASLEWAHPAGTCCHHDDHGALPVGDDDGSPATVPGGGCAHDSLAIDTAPAPRGANHDLAPAAAIGVVDPLDDHLPPYDAPPPRPPATGPPRPDRRTALRAVSLLLL